jgi:type VI secretion system protein ImpB
LERKELPFVVGVMADLSGQPAEPNAPLKQRKFVPIDRDNFKDVLASSKPRVATRVNEQACRRQHRVARRAEVPLARRLRAGAGRSQVPVLRELLEMRTQLSNLLGKLEGNDKLEKLLGEVLENSETAKTLAGDLGVEEEKARKVRVTFRTP